MEIQILGLKHAVPDNVNNLIFKFVGIKPRKFIEELDFLMLDYLVELCRRYGIDEDYVIEHSDDIAYLLFHRWVPLRGNCRNCFKNKRNKTTLYCNKCDIIEFQEYQERCMKRRLGDGCD